VYKITLINARSLGVPPSPEYPGGWQADRDKPLNTQQKRGKNVSATGEKVADARLAGRAKTSRSQRGMFVPSLE
jgi:hypothetical protein